MVARKVSSEQSPILADSLSHRVFFRGVIGLPSNQIGTTPLRSQISPNAADFHKRSTEFLNSITCLSSLVISTLGKIIKCPIRPSYLSQFEPVNFGLCRQPWKRKEENREAESSVFLIKIRKSHSCSFEHTETEDLKMKINSGRICFFVTQHM